MEQKEEKNVTLSLLTYYDKKLKKWVLNQNCCSGSNIIFADRINFPNPGQDNMLYVDKDSIYQWNSEKNDYIKLSGGVVSTEAELTWEPFPIVNNK